MFLMDNRASQLAARRLLAMLLPNIPKTPKITPRHICTGKLQIPYHLFVSILLPFRLPKFQPYQTQSRNKPIF